MQPIRFAWVCTDCRLPVHLTVPADLMVVSRRTGHLRIRASDAARSHVAQAVSAHLVQHR